MTVLKGQTERNGYLGHQPWNCFGVFKATLTRPRTRRGRSASTIFVETVA
jgi:hypothetical protein